MEETTTSREEKQAQQKIPGEEPAQAAEENQIIKK